ncbi:PatB family C-S lyase [Aestuariibacter halophilus]|uniref:cysteine-S-conjugate beta-lyase n=1 Tax=Fluctibacter halophilus TaxID=226011 RepID=A0ABS8G9L9_9ALTE|nr:PatB family C-S lyase [Aestuariibacter halophilus]MCC2617272.1 PatB family C-S lyase [Aestuariibacter halophilus]
MDFDRIIDRRSNQSFKWQKYAGKDILPMWVADTEFACAQPILDALHERIDHGPLGYHLPVQQTGVNQAVVRWLRDKHDWDIRPEWIVWTPGVVPAFNVACRAYCQPGDKVIVQTPNYPPLLAAPALHGLTRVDVPSVVEAGRWTLDFAALEAAMADPKCTLFILCNPMNPVGSVLTAQELSHIARLCEQHDVMLCSDEIHCDLILEPGVRHLPAGKQPALAGRSVTLMAASKTFNIAGLGTSFAIIPDSRIRQRFESAAKGLVPWANLMGLVATEAAFTQCDDWLEAQLQYLRENRTRVTDIIDEHPGLQMITPPATFLAWVDASGLDSDDPQGYFEQRGIGPSPGKDFGAPDFVRINFGCPKAHLDTLAQRLKT